MPESIEPFMGPLNVPMIVFSAGAATFRSLVALTAAAASLMAQAAPPADNKRRSSNCSINPRIKSPSQSPIAH
jgi:hypothetical protein